MMIDLCTVTNSKYLPNAIALVNSYIYHSYTGRIFLYYFDISNQVIEEYKSKYPNINFVDIPKVCKHAYEPNVFFYKAYTLKDCIDNSDCFLYSDATNLIQKNIEITDFFLNDSLLLPYTHSLLINKHWTTQKCLHKMNAINSSDRPQYWAGLQGYKNTKDNQKLINLMYEYMLDSDIALPGTLTDFPEGKQANCIQHRCDQSVLSILIDQLNRHQTYNEQRQTLFGDKQTFKLLDPNYTYSIHDVCISSRQTKYLL